MNKSDYKQKVIESIIKEIIDYFKVDQIVSILQENDFLQDNDLYTSDNSSTVLNTVFLYIKDNFEYPENDTKISKVISDFLYPLNHKLSTNTASELKDKISKCLNYINYSIIEDDTFVSGFFIADQQSIKEYIENFNEPEVYVFEDEQYGQFTWSESDMDTKKIKENKSLIDHIEYYHKEYIEIIEEFFINRVQGSLVKNIDKINKDYLYYLNLVEAGLKKLDLKSFYKINIYVPFGKSLYFAESKLSTTEGLSVEKVRANLLEVQGDIENLNKIPIRFNKADKLESDYIDEAIKYFKKEYVVTYHNIDGFDSYKYFLSEVLGSPESYYDEKYEVRLSALKKLVDTGVVENYQEKLMENDNGSWLYAFCKINESILLGKSKNSMIKPNEYYITKKEGIYFYKEVPLKDFNKSTEFYKIFEILFKERPKGGEISYDDLITKIKDVPKLIKGKKYIIKYIQDNITGNKNGFIPYISKYHIDEKYPLTETMPKIGIRFNNKID